MSVPSVPEGREVQRILPEFQSETMSTGGEQVLDAVPVITDQDLFTKQTSLLRDAIYRLFRNKLAILGLAFIVLLVFCAVFANFVSPYGYAEKVPGEFYRTRPNYWFPFGTDNVGRDVFTRIMFGSRISMFVGLGVTAIQLLIGVTVGSIAAYFSGTTDTLMMRFVDVISTLPTLMIAIILLAWRGPGVGNVIFALGIIGWVTIARLTRGQMLSLRELDYIKASRVAGGGGWYIVVRHLLPNSLTPLIVAATFAIPEAIFGEAFLSFIGIGIRPPQPSWGDMVAEGQQFLRSDPHLAITQILCVFLTMLAFRFLGDGLRDALDPKANN
jgi:ABC-type dipeptide/oligopeptide/nickel transport system permease subunit